MADSTVSNNIVSIGSEDVLNEILRQGAQQMLTQASENEVAEYPGRHADSVTRTAEAWSFVMATYLPTYLPTRTTLLRATG